MITSITLQFTLLVDSQPLCEHRQIGLPCPRVKGGEAEAQGGYDPPGASCWSAEERVGIQVCCL